MQLETHREQGFTLVELLIVAIILAILAAIVVPQFASTTNDAEESALKANLAAIRSSIDLYRQQHGEYPGTSASTGGTCTGGTAGTGAALNQTALEEQLASYTNQSNQSCTLKLSGAFPFGPYLKDDKIPANPITKISTVAIINTGNLAMTADGTDLGWKYDVLTGKFIANDTTLDSKGVAYSSY